MSTEATERLVIYGSSDDLIEVDGKLPGCDEYAADKAYLEVAGLRIGVEFCGTWLIAVQQIDEEVPVTAVIESLVVHENGYSMELSMLVPVGTYVSRVREEGSGA
jgi:hypothetical protein